MQNISLCNWFQGEFADFSHHPNLEMEP